MDGEVLMVEIRMMFAGIEREKFEQRGTKEGGEVRASEQTSAKEREGKRARKYCAR